MYTIFINISSDSFISLFRQPLLSSIYFPLYLLNSKNLRLQQFTVHECSFMLFFFRRGQVHSKHVVAEDGLLERERRWPIPLVEDAGNSR